MDKLWLKDYEELMHNGKIHEAIALKGINFPTSLFKYRAINENTWKGLLHGTVWTANARAMNDLFESWIRVDYNKVTRYQMSQKSFWEPKIDDYSKLGITLENIEKVRLSADPLKGELDLLRPFMSDPDEYDKKVSILDQMAHQRLETLTEEQIDHLKSMVRLCSFSMIKDSKLMWVHYSSNNKGICIEYDYSHVDRLAKNTHPVMYPDDTFDATDFYIDPAKTHLLSMLSTLYKETKWAYEEEWRFVMPNGLFDTDRAIDVPMPKAIYFGAEIGNEENLTTLETLSNILTLCEQKNILKFKMKISHSSRSLIAVPDHKRSEINSRL